jgi:hypothetical protein
MEKQENINENTKDPGFASQPGQTKKRQTASVFVIPTVVKVLNN